MPTIPDDLDNAYATEPIMFAKDDLPMCGRDSWPADVPKPSGPRPLRDPKMPPAAGRAKHALTNLPYKDWCPHCLAGRRPNQPHTRVKHHSDLPMLGIDYGYVGDDGGPLVTFLVVLVRPFGVYVSALVDAKGPTAFTVHLI